MRESKIYKEMEKDPQRKKYTKVINNQTTFDECLRERGKVEGGELAKLRRK